MLGIIAIISLVYNTVLWKSVRGEQKDYNTLVYDQLAMNLFSQMQAGSGYTLAPHPDYAIGAIYVHGAANDLQLLEGPLAAQGVNFVGDMSAKLDSIQEDFLTDASTKTLASDAKYLQQAYAIFESKCYSHGHVVKAGFWEAFADIHALPQ